MPVVLDLAEGVARRAAPGAWIVDFTNPVGIVSQALARRRATAAIGLCNVAIGLQRRFAAQFGVAPERVELEHVGLNHLSWAARRAGRRGRSAAGLIEADADADGAKDGRRPGRGRPR